MVDVTKLLYDRYLTQLLLDNSMTLLEDEDLVQLRHRGKCIATFSGCQMNQAQLTKIVEAIIETGY